MTGVRATVAATAIRSNLCDGFARKVIHTSKSILSLGVFPTIEILQIEVNQLARSALLVTSNRFQLWQAQAVESANQVSQVWGCALLLRPAGRPISTSPEVELTWPGRETPVRGTGRSAQFGHCESAYVRDEVLMDYEKRGEFEIQPEDGFVGYGGRWSVSFCRRMSRNFLELELRKLYEGAPFEVIRHYQKFATSEALADRDAEENGRRHVGMRAKDLINSFFSAHVSVEPAL